MDIVVCVKTNPDPQMVRIRNREPVLEAVPYKLGDLDKNALEAAIQVRDAVGGKVVAVTVAETNRKIKETVKEALAMGADEAVIVDDPAAMTLDQAAVATVIAAAVKKLPACDLLLFGEGSSDNYTGQVPSRVAEKLGVPQVGYARKVEAAEGAVCCERSMDEMIETLELPLPAAVTVVSEINEPRIPSLMHIMKAGSKPTQVWTLADIGVDAAALAPKQEVVSNLAEEQDRKHVLFEGAAAEQAAAFVDALVKEGVVGR
ncbi:MAG TPA: electron transfer flavoprotein subunit beta/FixA family protein [Thermoleophilia bacterium]|nr:electron transfer flavoprotein subunit beta/FixA family protein [Thermoleophilia bacterium]